MVLKSLMARFLNRLWGLFDASSRNDFPGNKVGDTEQISRFLTHKSHVSGSGGVRYNAFMPPPNLRLSVYRTDGMGARDMGCCRPIRRGAVGKAGAWARAHSRRGNSLEATRRHRFPGPSSSARRGYRLAER
jgi:hypothetical protein